MKNVMFSLLKWGSEPSIAIDLGTRNTLVSNQLKIVYCQQTLTARSLSDSSKIVVGESAQIAFDRDPTAYQIVRPLQRGVICDLKNCTELVSTALRSAGGGGRIAKPNVLVSVPLDTTPVERATFREVLSEAGYRRVATVPEPAAAAAGLVRDFVKKKGVVVVDVGAGITECALFSFGGAVCNTSERTGGEDFENEIINFFKRRFGFEIGIRAALEVLGTMARQSPDSYLAPHEVRGINTLRRMPATLNFELHDIADCLDALFARIVNSILALLDQAPAELSAEIVENGVMLTGGASQFKRLIAMIEKQTSLRVEPDSQALLGVARGQVALLQCRKLREAILPQFA